MKPIEDDKLLKILAEKRDYNIQSDVSDVMTRYSSKKTSEIFEKPAKKRKNPAVLGSIFGISTCLAVSVFACFISFGVAKNREYRENISSNLNILSSDKVSKTLAKQLLLFDLTRDDFGNNPKMLDQSPEMTIGDNLTSEEYEFIVDGFEKIAPIFFNRISSFDAMAPKTEALKTPVKIVKDTFKNRFVSTYETIDMKYYFNANSNQDYGISEINDKFYKTYIYNVRKYKNSSLEIYFEGLNNETYFKISENDIKNSFTYKEFNSEADVNDNIYSYYYNVKLGEVNSPSKYILKSRAKYEIYYNDISLKQLEDLFKILFDVEYVNLMSNSSAVSFKCSCLEKDGINSYLIGDKSFAA